MISSMVYGPVPSRRLGRSLGINNIPPKICPYSCVYCQLGRTDKTQIRRQAFYEPADIARSVSDKVKQLKEKHELVDYLAFVPDGEPTLDINLGQEIELLKGLGIKIAVITNASLIGREEVRKDLQKADWVCLKVDAVMPGIWHSVNKPQKQLELENILDGMLRFSRCFHGKLVTETMLVKGINDDISQVRKIADFLAELKPVIAYLAVPTRPPAERIKPATEQTLNEAYQIFKKKLNQVEFLIGYEGNTFTSTGNPCEDLLSITAVHPMREDAVVDLLNRLGDGWETIHSLIKEGSLVELEYLGKRFYARKIKSRIAKNVQINATTLT